MSSKSDHDTLVEMGFPPDKVARAFQATKGAGLQPAMDWLLSHPGDLDEPAGGQSLGGQPSGEASGSVAIASSSGYRDPSLDGEIQDGEQTAQSLKCDDCQKLFRDGVAAERHASRSGHVNFSESTTPIKPLTEEEKVAKREELKRILAEKKELRLLQEKEEEKRREKVRRKTGKDLTEAKEKLEEKEMQKILLAKKKEKEEERLAKAKIKAQIEADKKERTAKREAAKQAALDEQKKEASESSLAPKEYTEARLQIRQPSGSPIIHTFQATDTLEVVYELVGQHVPGSFKLMTTFPRLLEFNEIQVNYFIFSSNMYDFVAL
ncbi:3415_t:CDS:2 [Funneliformis geosporum]|uniref:3415_t:CDS:1 n=1 Tax=Funneliformis geosporum TaxID=1117311 RepID=A0A9W4SIA5_9GLOM|nr:3415_t:CDS:2 [Funneliformis geosporum]